jgi:hypothetical protein
MQSDPKKLVGKNKKPFPFRINERYVSCSTGAWRVDIFEIRKLIPT